MDSDLAKKYAIQEAVRKANRLLKKAKAEAAVYRGEAARQLRASRRTILYARARAKELVTDAERYGWVQFS